MKTRPDEPGPPVWPPPPTREEPPRQEAAKASLGERAALACSVSSMGLVLASILGSSFRHLALSESIVGALDVYVAFPLLICGLLLGLICRRTWRGIIAVLIPVAVFGLYIYVIILTISER